MSESHGSRSVPPVAKRVDSRREHHGDVFIDPYEWLREKTNPDVIAYLEAENDYVDQMTALVTNRHPVRARTGIRSRCRSRCSILIVTS